MEQRWMSAIEVCTYAGEIQRLSEGNRRIIMIQQLSGRDGALLFWCKSLLAATPQSNPWLMIPVRMDDLDATHDVYILYTQNSHFSFAKPVPPDENSRPNPATKTRMSLPDMHLSSLAGPKGGASRGKGKEPADDTSVKSTQLYLPGERCEEELVAEFSRAIKDPPRPDVVREWLRGRHWIVTNSIADLKSMM